MAILKNGAPQPNEWLNAADNEDLPDSKPVVVSLERWNKDRATLLGRNAPVGLRLRSDQSPALAAEDIERFALIVLEFPKFTDGRAYSYARILRERLGYRGEIRAAGQVLRDQYLFMTRCGIDSIEIADETKIGGYLEALGEFSVWYQPAADERRTAQARRLAKRHNAAAGGSAIVRESVAASWAY
jgi:uncharacterized protein (DUF934 family)